MIPDTRVGPHALDTLGAMAPPRLNRIGALPIMPHDPHIPTLQEVIGTEKVPSWRMFRWCLDQMAEVLLRPTCDPAWIDFAAGVMRLHWHDENGWCRTCDARWPCDEFTLRMGIIQAEV